jgi:phospholipid/cholesterol/gamma-HCH transport system substrate-binding protein
MRYLSRMAKGLRGSTGRNLLKVTLYSLLCLVVLFALIGRIGNIDWFSKHESYKAEMPDVTGLLVNDDVKVAGVRVGKVTRISVDRGKAIVSFQVKPSVKLRTSTQVGVRWRNVLGQKYLYLYPGTSGPVLKPGARLPASQVVRSADVGEFLNSVAPILRAIDPAKANAFVRALNEALDGNEDKVRGLLSDTATISHDLGGSDQQIGNLIDNLDTVVGGLANRDGDLNTAVTRFKTLASSLADNNDDLQLLVERFAAVQTRLNTLVKTNRGNIDQTVDDLATIAKVLHGHRSDLDQALATLPQGLRIYDSISSYGQWFQIRVKISCLANQQNCSYEGSTSDALNGGAPNGPQPDPSSIPTFALSGGGL